MMEVDSNNFIPLVNVALENTKLKESRSLLGKGLAYKRAKVIADLPEFEKTIIALTSGL